MTGAGIGAVGFAGAFLGGLAALLSPCAALLLPAFFGYAFDRPGRLVARTAVFYLGMAAVLVPLGAGVGAVGALLTVHRDAVTAIAGWTIIALGALVALGGGFGPTRLPRAARGVGALNVAVLGAAYGLAGFCSGPLLGAILTVALAGGSPVRGGALMAVYAAGMAAPLLLLAAAWSRLDPDLLRGRRIGRFRVRGLVAGALLIALGAGYLATGAGAGLPGVLDVGAEAALQRRLLAADGAWAALAGLAILAVVLAAELGRRRRAGRAGRPAPAPAPADPPDRPRGCATGDCRIRNAEKGPRRG